MITDKIVTRKPRNFVAEEFKVESWETLKDYYSELLSRSIDSKADLLSWMKDRSELDSIVEEDYCWRYINKTRDTTNSEYESDFNHYIETIEPKRQKQANSLNLKVANSPYFSELDDDRFLVYKRGVNNNINLFREENIALFTKEENTKNRYYKISGAMTVEHDGKELTLQQASAFLNSSDRNLRAEMYQKILNRKAKDTETLDNLLSELLTIRHQIALNAGFDNFRDYKLQSLGRFDYGVKECEQFHDAIEHSLVPLMNDLMQYRKEQLNVDVLRPYDLQAVLGKEESKLPYNGTDELVDKSIECLDKIDPYFGQCIQIMKNMNYLDLDSRKGKAPGGYNCPLPEIGVPYIFMNSANTPRDLKTMIHEGGHAVHTFLTADLDYNFDKRTTSEAAELASMSMEMFALDAYETFYPNKEERKRAIYNFLESNLVTVPWIALIDKFQHWLYTNPGHTVEERSAKWVEFAKRFSSNVVDKSGYEENGKHSWQMQLHIYMVPFYYIEYGIARLGSIGLYRNYKKDAKSTIEDYKSALKMGYTEPLPNIYEKAGIPFNFSKSYIKELADFMKTELN